MTEYIRWGAEAIKVDYKGAVWSASAVPAILLTVFDTMQEAAKSHPGPSCSKHH